MTFRTREAFSVVTASGWPSRPSGEGSLAKFMGKGTRWDWKGSSSCSEEPQPFPRTTCQTVVVKNLPLPGAQVALNLAGLSKNSQRDSLQVGFLTCRSTFNTILFSAM